jgi:hypothetical protein
VVVVVVVGVSDGSIERVVDNLTSGRGDGLS